MNPWRIEADRRSEEIGLYADWIDSNQDNIIDKYADQLEDFPDYIYEHALDDDYPQVETQYLENLTIEDVPDYFISDMYQQYLEGD